MDDWPRITERFLQLVEKFYPAWAGFTEERFERHEGDYKRKAAPFVQERLSKDEFASLIEGEPFDEVIDRLWQIGKKTNLLFNRMPREGDLSVLAVEDLDKPAFCRAFYNLLYGTEDVSARIDRYASFTSSNSLPNTWRS